MITSLSEFRGHSLSSTWSRIRSTIAMTLLLIATSASAQERFKNPDDAVAALVNAAKATDRAAVIRLFGPGSGEIVSSGDAVADATARKRVLEAYDSRHQVVGYRAGQQRMPYHGYYYRVLTRQGPSALGGAIDYVVRGKMIGGFALVAYPAEYGNSGVMTFVVNHQGVVFQKDLGLSTARVAGAMTTFNPDQSWSRVVIQQPQSQR